MERESAMNTMSNIFERLMQDTAAPINSMDFHRTEDLLVTASEDDSLHVYRTSSGELDKVSPLQPDEPFDTALAM